MFGYTMKITYEFDNFFCFFLSLLATENLQNLFFFQFLYFSFWWYIANKKKRLALRFLNHQTCMW